MGCLIRFRGSSRSSYYGSQSQQSRRLEFSKAVRRAAVRHYGAVGIRPIRFQRWQEHDPLPFLRIGTIPVHSLMILGRSLSFSAKPGAAVDLPHKLHPSSHSAFGRTHHPSTPRKNAPMKALLLYPELPERFWSFKHILRFVGQRATLPALGLFTVAAMLPDKWEIRISSRAEWLVLNTSAKHS